MSRSSLKNIQDFWNKEWILKCISLMLAFLLWYFVGGEEKVDKSVKIPVEVINLPRDLVISNQYKKEIDVTVNGPRSLISELNKEETSLQVDLSNSESGSKVINITGETIKMPHGVTIQRVQPSSIILSLEKLIQKKFEIKANKWGKVADGYEVEKISVDPDTVTITGPQTQLSQVEQLETQLIDINGLDGPVQLQVPLALDTGIVDLIGETSVTVDVEVRMIMVDRIVRDIPLQVIVDGIEQRITPSKVTLEVRIPRLLIDQRKRVNDLFTVTTLGNIEDKKLKVQVIPNPQIKYPVEIKSINPAYVTLEDLIRSPTVESETTVFDELGNYADSEVPFIKKNKEKRKK